MLYLLVPLERPQDSGCKLMNIMADFSGLAKPFFFEGCFVFI